MSAIDVLPHDFTAHITEIYTEVQQHQIWKSFESKSAVSYRINTLKWTLDEADYALNEKGFHIETVDFCDRARRVPYEQRDKLIATEYFDDGRIYVQNLSSMLAPVALNPQPNEQVLDLAAAPGGKTTMIASMMNNQGLLSAVEPVKGRFFKLKANLDRAGVEIVKCYMMDGRAVGTKTPERFDRILLDAPCSSEARFKLDKPDSWSHWNTRKVKECAKKQKRLILSAFNALKVGGEMVYCTCSFSPEENELVIASLIKRCGSAVSIEPISLGIENTVEGITEWKGKSLPVEISKSTRVIPNELFDGFYLCRIKKQPDT